MNSSPLVTIVTPSLNQGPFIRPTIESVLSQDYPHIEYVVMDGGSTDSTLDVLKSYGDRVRWISEPDRGQSHAINKGFKAAKGDIVAYINSDDVLLPGAVRKAAEAFVRDPELGMVYGEGFILEEDGAVRCPFPYSEPFDLWRLVYYWDSILQQSVYMRKSALEAIGWVDESLHWGMDWDLFIRLAKSFPVERLDAEMGAIRDYSDTKAATGGFRRWRELSNISCRHAGRRITPACLIFFLDTYYKMVSARFGSPSSGGAKGLLSRGLLFGHGIASHFLWPYLHDSQGWFEDGWAAPTVHLAFPRCEGEARLEVEGSLPESFAAEQSLEVAVNGKVIGRRVVSAGRFQLSEPLPEQRNGAEMLGVELRASKVIDRRQSPRGRGRRLCYQLDEVRLATPTRSFVCIPPQMFG
ncbi:MAG: glycosyltransferase family 2 protein [Bryobacterales bacterium]